MSNSAIPAPSVHAPTPEADARALRARLEDSLKRPPLLSAAHDQLADALRGDSARRFRELGPFAACLLPLLDALNWRGSARELIESLPHFADELEITDLLNVMVELGYVCRTVRVKSGRIDRRLLPAILVPVDRKPLVVLRATDGGFWCYCSAKDKELEVAPHYITGELQVPVKAGSADHGEDSERRQENWVGELGRRFAPAIWSLFAITAVLNLFAVLVSLYMMTIYDRVIPSRNGETLAYLAIGVGLLVLIDAGLRQARAHLVAHVGARIETIVAGSSFRQIIDLPAAMVETAPVGAQMSRIREFDSIRDIFTGPVVNVALELPFIPLFLAVIWWLAGPVVWVPIAMLVVYGLIWSCIRPMLRRRVRHSSRARAQRQEFLIDLFRNIRAIKQLAAEAAWQARFSDVSAETALAHFEVVKLTHLLQAVAQAVMVAAGVGAIAWSVVRVVDGEMTMGAMIAVMALSWRLLQPMQSLFLALTRLEQALMSARQLNQLMRTPTESRRGSTARRFRRNIEGAIAFERVSFRYRNAGDPALFGITFAATPGQLIAVTGGSGAGKSTLLGVALGMNRPQAGTMLIDGVDIRQIDPVELRQIIAYVPQETALFHGTIAQNLRLGHPLASDEELRQVCARLGILNRIEDMPAGFDTRLGDQSEVRFSAGFRQTLAIARALVKKAPVILMDEPAQLLDRVNDDAFVEVLKQLKGHATTIMVSHRPSHIMLADKVAVLERGQLAGFGPPQDILAKQADGVAGARGAGR